MKHNSTNTYQVADRIVTISLVVFAVIIVLLIASFALHTIYQQITTSPNGELLTGVDELQEATESLQEAVENLSALPPDDPQGIDESLEEIDSSLQIIEQSIEEISSDVEALTSNEMDELASPPSVEEIEEIQDGINQIFVIISWLIGGLSILTAITLAVVFNTRQKPRRYTPLPKPMKPPRQWTA